MTRINATLDRALALVAIFDFALVAWWWFVRRRQQRAGARATWVRRDEAEMRRAGLIRRRTLWDDEGLITPDDLPRDE